MSVSTVHVRVQLTAEPETMGADPVSTVGLQLAAADGGDAYDVTAIDAGSGNGWAFTPDVIAASAPLWQRVNCYLGHAGHQDRGPNGERQPRDLCGVFSGGYFDPATSGIRGRLKLAGPAAPMARLVAQAYLEAYDAGTPAPDVGLSASLLLEPGDGKRVVRIVEVESLDVIATRPARGGKFEAALSRVVEDPNMRQAVRVALSAAPSTAAADIGATGNPVVSETAAVVNPAALASAPVGSPPALGAPTGANPVQPQQAAAVANPAAGSVATQVAQPVAAQAGADVAGAIATLSAQVAQLQAALAQQAAPTVVQGLSATDGGRRDGASSNGNGRVRMGQAPIEELQLAVDHLFGVRTPAGASFSRLRSYRWLYEHVTGDKDMLGVFDGERAEFANATSTTLNDLTKNALNKYVQQYFQDAYLWWEQIAQIVDFGTLQDPTWVTLGGFGDLPTVAEGGAYGELTIADTGETSQWLKKGGFIGITLEAIDKDDTGRITQIPQKLAMSAYRTLSAAVAALFTANAGAGPALQDGFNLFSANHNNVAVTPLTAANWEAAVQAMYKQPELNSNRRLGARPERLLVPVELEATAAQIVGSEVMDANLQRNVRKGSAQVVTCPEFTDANDWAAVADPTKNPAIGVGFRFGRVPEVFSDPGGQRMFTNDQMDLKVRFFFTIGVIDWRAALKRNVP